MSTWFGHRLKKSSKLVTMAILTFYWGNAIAQTPEEVLARVREKLEKVNDYEAAGKMRTNVIFIKAPVASVKVYFKKPNRLKIRNESGISFIPKGSVNMNLNNIFLDAAGYDIIDMGKEAGTGFRIIKLLPKEDNSDVVLSTLYIDEAQSLIRKSKTTTRENGTYELEMKYGKYSEFGLADKVVFSFNTKDYKLPKGVTFDYDDGEKKETGTDRLKGKKGRVEIVYTSYTINKGVSDQVFQ
jgi:outer membrane lipoprotein-sorting protein